MGEGGGFERSEEDMGRAQDASISFDSVRDKNVMQLRKLNTAIFPVSYQDKFYTDALNSGNFTKLGKIRRIVCLLLICASSVHLFTKRFSN